MTGADAGRHRPRRYPVAVLGAFGIDNFGNDATLDATMHGLDGHVRPSEVLCICSVPQFAAGRFGVDVDALHGSPQAAGTRHHSTPVARLLARLPAEIRRAVAAHRRARQVGTLVVAGTGALDDQHIGAGGLPLDMAIWCLAARAAGAKVVMLSVGAGPINSPISRALLRAATAATHDISYRDVESRDYMRSIGRDVRDDRVAPDLVFGLSPPAVRRRAGASTTVAIGVLWSGNWANRPGAHRRYQQELIGLVTRLWASGRRVLLLIGDRADEPARGELAAALAEIDGDRSRDALECPPVTSFDDVLAAVAACDVAVVSRYHHVVAALTTLTPVVSLEYGFKNRALMTAVGLATWCLDVDEFDADDVADRVASLAGAEFPSVTSRTLRAWRDDVARQFDAVFEIA